MAIGALKNSNAKLTVAITGIAGPTGGTKTKPVGLVYFASNYKGKVIHQQKIFDPSFNIKEEIVTPIDKNKNYLYQCYLYSERVYNVLVNYPDHIVYSQGLSVWYNIKKISARLIINPHGLEPYQGITLKEKLMSIPFKLIFNFLFKNAHKVVSLGGRLTDILNSTIKQAALKIVVLPNAVELAGDDIKKSYTNTKLKMLFVARFAHNKGIHILLEAIKQLNDEGYKNKLEFNLGGKGPLFEHYSTNFNYANVNYLGFVTDEQLVNLYRTNDLFVFPTLFEGMPTVVLEAMSFGMPVIVSDVGATAELVNSSTGYLIHKNSVLELKQAIISFYNLSVIQKHQLSSDAFLHVKNNYTWKKVAEKHIELFRTMNF
jgi:glycosyltransferase involved in cell wall biosynthesis